MIRLHRVREAKQVGIIYHFTHNIAFLKILSDKGFKTVNHPFISFTRNYNLLGDFGQFRFALDGDRLSNKYHIEPYMDTEYAITRGHEGREERILWPTGKLLPVLGYVIQIDILRSGWKRFTPEMQDEVNIGYGNLGIPIHLVNDFLPVKHQ